MGLLAVVLSHGISSAENSATVPVPRDQEEWLERHRSMNRRVEEGRVGLLWIGDSIVQNWENQGKSTWDKYYAGREAVNLGISGDRTEHVLWRLQHGNLEGGSPQLAIVMIGQNNGGHNSAHEIAQGVTAIVESIRNKLPDTKILLLGIFFRGEKPNEEQITLAAANEELSRLDDGVHIHYMNINRIFLRPDGTIPGSLMPDFEHPSAEGHRIWAEAIEPKVAELLGEKPIQP
jgi:beta-glucosidase